VATDVNKVRRPRFGRVLVKATTGPVNLIVVGSAALGALALHSWPLLALGGVAYGALVAWDAASPKTWKKSTDALPPIEQLPQPDKVADPATRAAVAGILAARRELARVLRDTPVEVTGHLSVALASAAELEARAARLVTRAEELAAYLRSTDAEAVRRQLAELEAQASRTGDEEARTHYRSAQAARRDHLLALADVAGAHERIGANLARIGATLEGLPAKIVRLRALDAQAMDSLSGNVNEELDSFNLEIKSFEETLRSLVEVPVA
jgi:hypothetical protein